MSPSERVSSYLTFSPLALRPVLFCGTFYRVPPVFVSKAWRSALSGLSSSTKVPAVERATASKLHPVEGGLGSFENRFGFGTGIGFGVNPQDRLRARCAKHDPLVIG